MADAVQDVERLIVEMPKNMKRQLCLLATRLGVSQAEIVRRLVEGKLSEYPELTRLVKEVYGQN